MNVVSEASTADPAEIDDVTLRRAQRGDSEAWRALVLAYQRPVFALIGRMLGRGRGQLVEDVAQETFLAVFRSLRSFSPLGPAKLSTWILTIATRRALDELRRPLVASADPDDAGPASRVTPATRVAAAAAIERALAALAPEYRAAFVLRELHGLDYVEIARALSVDVGTVKSRLSRGRQQLRAALEEVRDG